LPLLETKICNNKGQVLPNDPQELEKIFRKISERREDADLIIKECNIGQEPAWLYDVDVFQGIDRIHLVSTKQVNLKVKTLRVDNYDANLTIEDEGGFSIRIPSLPGCNSQGETEKEAIANIKDALRSYIEVAKKYKIPL
jgi:antitoxin HicB